MRAFIAIEVPDAIKREMATIQEQFRSSGVSAGWTRPEGIHLTLKFLGEVPEARAPEIANAIAAAAGGTGTLGLTVEGAGAFPNEKNPRVLWLGVTGDLEKLARLQALVEDATAKLGFGAEDRKFRPHLTLARIRFPRPRDNWQQRIAGITGVRLGNFEAGHVSLIKSELRPSGAVYTEVGRIELR